MNDAVSVSKAGERRIYRAGDVQRRGDGCAAIRVSVPCESCPGFCGTGSSGTLEVSEARLIDGDSVAVSVSAPGMQRVAMVLFGPPLCWFALLAVWLPNSDPLTACLALGAGLPVVWLGRKWANGLVHRLDLRVARQSCVVEN